MTDYGTPDYYNADGSYNGVAGYVDGQAQYGAEREMGPGLGGDNAIERFQNNGGGDYQAWLRSMAPYNGWAAQELARIGGDQYTGLNFSPDGMGPAYGGRMPVNYTTGAQPMAGSTYTYTDPATGQTLTGTYGDNTVLPLTPAGTGDISSGATGTGAIATAMGGGGSSGGGGGGGSGYNPALLSAAQQAANQAYLNARLRELEIPQMQAQTELAKQQFALQKAQEAFQQTLQQANLTGYVQDKPTNYAEQAVGNYARNGGNGIAAWQAAVPGLTDAEAAQVNERMRTLYGQTHASATEDQARAILRDVTGGRIGSDQVQPPTPTLARQEYETGASGYLNGAPTLARQQYETDASLRYLGMVNDLKKTNPFAYVNTLTNTPTSIRDLLNKSLQGMGIGGGINAAAGLSPTGAGGGAGGEWGQTMPGRMVNATGTPPDAGGSALPLGSQINARDWLNSSPYLKRLALQGYEANNQDPDQVMSDFQKSLPSYAGASGARYAQPV